jgi:hypothetical protein
VQPTYGIDGTGIFPPTCVMGITYFVESVGKLFLQVNLGKPKSK